MRPSSPHATLSCKHKQGYKRNQTVAVSSFPITYLHTLINYFCCDTAMPWLPNVSALIGYRNKVSQCLTLVKEGVWWNGGAAAWFHYIVTVSSHRRWHPFHRELDGLTMARKITPPLLPLQSCQSVLSNTLPSNSKPPGAARQQATA
jgi:hypothetical protein